MIIPRRIYRATEARLRARYTAIEEARDALEMARAMAYSAQAAPMDPNGGSHGTGRGDALERKAISVHEAEEELRRVLAWDDVFHRMDRIYPVDTPEGRVGWYLYQNGLTQADISTILGCDRQTVRRHKDIYVLNCALLAAMAGLVRMGDEDPQGNSE